MQLLMRQVMPQKYRGMEMYIFSSSAAARSKSLRNVIEAQHGIDELGQLTMPVTLIQGTKERPAYIQNLARVARKPNLKIIRTDSGHHTLVDNPKFTLKVLQELFVA
jgi:pimeloyl-ACP methyl ester carboxylesterase